MKVIAALILGICAIISASFISDGLTDLRTGDTLSEAQEKANSSRNAIMAFLKLQARDQAPGVSEQQHPVKTVRVVSTIQYYLR